MSDSPGSKLEKLYAFRAAHFELGKEFDEKKIRRILDMEPVANPEFLQETPERRRLVKMDDREAKREIEEARAKAEAAILADKNAGMEAAAKDQRIAALEAQLAALTAGAEAAPPAAEPGPIAAPAAPQKATAASGVPDASWPMPRILTYLEENNLPLPPKRGFGMTKTAVLDYTLDQIAKAAETKE